MVASLSWSTLKNEVTVTL